MKNKYKYRKKFKELADSMGFFDKAELVYKRDEVNKKDFPMLINNHKRFVDGMLALSLSEQKRRIKEFEKLQSTLESDLQAGKLNFNDLLKEAQTPETSQEDQSLDSASQD